MIGIINKYRKLSKPTKASLWFVLSNVVLKGISFFTLPIFSRLLTTSQYGIISVYSSWVATISILTTLTIWGGVFNVGMVKFADKQKEMISSFQGLATSITLLFAIISIPFFNTLSQILGISKFLVICMYIEILSQIPLNIWITEQRYKFEYKAVVLITVINAVISPVIGIILVTSISHKAEARVISNMVVNLFIAIILFVHNQKDGKRFFDKEFWKFGFLFNVVLIPHYLSTQVLNQADRIMINSLCGSSDAGIYSVAYNFSLLLNLVTNGINSSLTPHIYQTLKDGDTSRLKKQTTGIVLIVATMAFALICVIPDVFSLLLPESYQEALYVIPPVTIGAFFLFLYPLFGSIEFYYEENKFVTLASVFGALLNVLLNYIFIKIFGFIAAAYTTLICYMLFSVFHYGFMKIVLKKNGKENNIYDIKAISLISIGLLAATFLIVSLYENGICRWAILISIGVVGFVFRKKLYELVKMLRK